MQERRSLCLANAQLEQIPLPEEGAADVAVVDLSFNQLVSLKGIERFERLTEIVLDNNELADDIVFPPMPELRVFTANNNKFTDLDNLLSRLSTAAPQLSYLSLLNNSVCPHFDEARYAEYRLTVLRKFPALCFLDSASVSIAERQASRILSSAPSLTRGSIDSKSRYTPLPSNSAQRRSSAVYEPVKHVYRGVHSEGNRFIRDNQL